MTEIAFSGHQTNSSTKGTPDITVDEDGDLMIYPTGVNGNGLVLYTSVADWRALNAAVEAAIAAPSAPADDCPSDAEATDDELATATNVRHFPRRPDHGG